LIYNAGQVLNATSLVLGPRSAKLPTVRSRRVWRKARRSVGLS